MSRNSFNKSAVDGACASARARNPHLFPPCGSAPALLAVVAQERQEKRIRQSGKPLLNKLEQEWFNNINAIYEGSPPIRCQAKRYRLGNGIGYSPDFTCSAWPDADGLTRETAWEVKGPHAFDGALDKLKVAAATYPEIVWWLCWKGNGGTWHQQRVLP